MKSLSRIWVLLLSTILLVSCQKDDFLEKKNQIVGVWRIAEYHYVEYFDGEISKTDHQQIDDKTITIQFNRDQTYSAKDEDEQVMWQILIQYEGVWRLMDAGTTIYFNLGVHEWPNDRPYGESAVYFRIKEMGDSHMIWEKETAKQYETYSRRTLTTITLIR